jgi:hypothetical protein
VDESYLAILRHVARHPREPLPEAMRGDAVTLWRFHLIHTSGNGFALDQDGIEAIVRHSGTPQWVRDAIERARIVGSGNR